MVMMSPVMATTKPAPADRPHFADVAPRMRSARRARSGRSRTNTASWPCTPASGRSRQSSHALSWLAHRRVGDAVVGAVDLAWRWCRSSSHSGISDGIERLEVAARPRRRPRRLRGQRPRCPRRRRPSACRSTASVPNFGGHFLDHRQLLVGVGVEVVDRHHRRHAELVAVLDVALEVDHALAHGIDVGLTEVVLGHAAVHLERAHGGDEHEPHRARGQRCGT